jgi:PEP-CTERM motif-containing protein
MNARCGASVFALTLLSVSIGFTSLVSADPLPGEILKFRQLPLNNTAACLPCAPPIGGAPYYGHDELSTAVLTSPTAGVYTGTYMADDFADKFSTPVYHIRWWGSYMNAQTAAPPPVTKFLISFEDDVAVGPNNPLPFSHPGAPKLTQVVNKGPLAPGSGTFTEKLLPTPLMPGMAPLEALYEYNAELHLGKEFRQEPNKVYWLKIVALVDTQQTQWGWHDRDWSILNPLASTPPAVVPGEGIIGAVVDPTKGFESPVYHFQDDAVQGPIAVFPVAGMPNMPSIEQTGWEPQRYIAPWDLPSTYHNQYSKDLAFELYTRIPEPTSLMLIGLGVLAFAGVHRSRTR